MTYRNYHTCPKCGKLLKNNRKASHERGCGKMTIPKNLLKTLAKRERSYVPQRL